MPRERHRRTRFFGTTPYAPDAEGVLRAVLPDHCVFAAMGEPCSIYEHHYRPRETGPCFPIAVVGCSAHPICCYTLYPLGHFPYGRQSLLISSSTGPARLDPETGRPPLEGTVFQAADAAASEIRWPEHSATVTPATRRTQGRHLERAGLLLGVHPAQGEGERERMATRLGVPTMTLRSGARLWSVDWTMRGAAIGLVFATLLVDGALLDRLLSAGYCAGLWPQPRRWAAPGRWIIARSVLPEHRPSIEANSRAPPPTTSLGAD